MSALQLVSSVTEPQLNSESNLNTEPGRHPDVLDAKQEPSENLYRQAQHQDDKQFGREHLQQRHALENLPAEFREQEQPVRKISGHQKIDRQGKDSKDNSGQNGRVTGVRRGHEM